MTITAEAFLESNQLHRALFEAYLSPNQLLEELEQKRSHLQVKLPGHVLTKEAFVDFLERYSPNNVAVSLDYQKLQTYRQLGGTYP